MTRRRYPSWRRRHEGVLLRFLEHPWETVEQCAKATGYSRTHLSRIINSPDFRARYDAAVEGGRREAFRRRFQRWG